MDEMRIKLGTNFMKGIVSKLISRYIFKKTGYKVNVQINGLDFRAVDGDTTVKLNMEVKLKSNEFNKLVKSISNI